jgi:hypothetical protein
MASRPSMSIASIERFSPEISIAFIGPSQRHVDVTFLWCITGS